MATTVSRPNIQIPKPNPQAHLRLFCFSYAGGGASIYRSWLPMLLPEVELCSVQLPGREERIQDPPFTQIPFLIENMTQAIRPYLTKPFIFFGHSMGALVSFELTRSLRKQQIILPLHIFASAHRAPQIPNRHPLIHQLPEAEFKEELYKLNGTPQNVLDNDELMQMMLPTLRADFTACETYVYEPGEPLSCPITAFGGLADKDINRDDLEAWRQQTRKSFQLHLYEGDHFFLYSEKERILRIINQELKMFLKLMMGSSIGIYNEKTTF